VHVPGSAAPSPDVTVRPWHALPVAEAAQAFQVDLVSGLSKEEAQRRLQRWGPNSLPEERGPAWPALLLRQFTQFLVAVLIVAAALSLALGERLDAAAILSIIVVNALLGFAQEYRAERALQSLRSLSAPTATALRDGGLLTMAATELVPGDVIRLEAGDVVPADARLIEVAALRLNEALLTGESVPVDKTVAAVTVQTELAERASMAYQGGLAVNGRGLAVVVATGERTEIGAIAASMQTRAARITPLQQRLASTGRWLVYGAGGLCALVFALGLARGIEFTEMVLTSASLAVAAIPEGLPAATTIVLALAVQRMARRQVIIRRLAAVETLGSVTVICVDKTGTLTENRMEAQELWLDGAFVKADAVRTETLGPTLRQALLAAVLCSDAVLPETGGGPVGDPTEVALLELAQRAGLMPAEVRRQALRLRELPFDAARARMTVVCRTAEGEMAYTKGAPEVIVPLATGLALRSGSESLDEAARRRVLAAAADMGSRGMRVLALTRRTVVDAETDDSLERELTVLGLVGLADPLRPEARPAIETAVAAGVRPVMLTGDHPVTAGAIARALGLPADPVVIGPDVEELPPEQLQEVVGRASVFGRVSSEHKLRIVEAFRASGQIVAMTGDGVNDAPALRSADIGVAMGQGGTDVARDASDMVLLDNNFRSIVSAVEEGRAVYDNIRKFVHYLLSCNLAEVLVVFLVLSFTGATALLPLQILFINLLTDGLPALALGAEPAEPGIMRRAPRPPQMGILNLESLVPLFGIGALIAGPTLAAYAWGHAQEGQPLARELAFATLIGTQLGASLEFRSPTRSVLQLSRNLWLVGAIGLSALLLVAAVYLPFLQPAFRTDGLSFEQWLVVVGLSLTPLLVVEAVKLSGLALRLVRAVDPTLGRTG
jgi:Ca2+-transporting ATPase